MVSVGKGDHVVLMLKGAVYDYGGRVRLFVAHFTAYEQDSTVYYDLWE